jgi:hypothetical protein
MNTKIILICAEVLAIAVLRLTFMMRRDRTMLPKGSKVRNIHGVPVFGADRPVPRQFQEKPAQWSVAGWTPPQRRAKVRDTPDKSPGAQQ